MASKILVTCFARLLKSPTDSLRPLRREGSSSGGLQSPRGQGEGVTSPYFSGSWSADEYKLALLSEQEIVYYLSMISYVAKETGDVLLPYREELTAVIDLALKVEERPGARCSPQPPWLSRSSCTSVAQSVRCDSAREFWREVHPCAKFAF